MAASKRPSPGSKSDKLWRDALMLAVNGKDDKGKRKLRALAEKTLELALDGDMAAIKEIGDRLDGKPAQAIVGDPDKPIVQRVESVIIDPKI